MLLSKSILQLRIRIGRLHAQNTAALTLSRKLIKTKRPSKLVFLHSQQTHNAERCGYNLNGMKCGALNGQSLPCSPLFVKVKLSNPIGISCVKLNFGCF